VENVFEMAIVTAALSGASYINFYNSATTVAEPQSFPSRPLDLERLSSPTVFPPLYCSAGIAISVTIFDRERRHPDILERVGVVDVMALFWIGVLGILAAFGLSFLGRVAVRLGRAAQRRHRDTSTVSPVR
jgi:hypothetical protein